MPEVHVVWCDVWLLVTAWAVLEEILRRRADCAFGCGSTCQDRRHGAELKRLRRRLRNLHLRTVTGRPRSLSDEPRLTDAELDAMIERMPPLQRTRLVPCCDGVLYQGSPNGGYGCTCWTPVYAEPQQPARPEPPRVRERPCSTCACHAAADVMPDGSEVPAGLDTALGWMQDRADRGEPFYCHEGSRVVVRWEHPTEPPRGPDDHWVDFAGHSDFPPLTVDGVPYRADGRPAELCYAWERRRRRGRST